MAAEQISGGPVATGGGDAVQAPPAPAPEAKDPRATIKEALSKLHDTDAEPDAPAETDAGDAPAGEPATEEPSAAAEPGAAPAAFSVDAYRQKIIEHIKDLTPEQRDEVFGATSPSFAALTAKRRRLHEEREDLLLKRGQWEAEKSQIAKERESEKQLRGEWDEALKKGKANPHEALALFGWSLQQAFEFDSTGQIPPDMAAQSLKEELDSKYDRRIKELEERLEREQSEKAEISSREQERANTETWHGHVRKTVSEIDGTSFPLLVKVPKERVFAGVIGLQTQAWQAHVERVKLAAAAGQPAPKFEPLAAERALGYLEGELKTNLGWFSDPAQAGAVETAKTEAGKGPKTLSATMVSERASGDGDFESPTKRMQAALRALRGES